jgi:DNA-binding MarR family transcriptional regulator
MSVNPISPPPRPLPALLQEVKMALVQKVRERLAEQGHTQIREGYGCVFGFIDLENGSRLTELAERSGFTKQAVGEAVTDLEKLAYVERLPDPTDGRAKIIKLTDWGMDAALKGRRVFADIEADWAEQLGPELLAQFREAATRIADLEAGAAADPGGRRRAA